MEVEVEEEWFLQFLPFGAGHAVWALTPRQSPTTQMFPAWKTFRLRPLSIGRVHRQGLSSCGCRSFSSPPAPACSSCLSSCQEGDLAVWRGFPESWLLEDSLAGPVWIFSPSSPHPGSHDYYGHSGELCSEMEGWRESLKGKGVDLVAKRKNVYKMQVTLNLFYD